MKQFRMLPRTLLLGALLASTSQQSLAQESLQVGPVDNLPNSGADYTPANSGVSGAMGAYSPQVNLEIPGASGDFVPNVNLIYSQGRSNGIAGVGWGLAFESRIERRSFEGGTPKFGVVSDEYFFLDGQRLWELSDGTYRTEQDDHTVYESIEAGGRIVSWTASKNGQIRTWGHRDGSSGTSNSIEYQDESIASGTASLATGSKSTAWLLARDEDSNGNRIDYYYAIQNYSAGLSGKSMRHVPTSVRYNYHPTAATSDYFSVKFAYEDRDDVRSSLQGITRYESHRLSTIQVENSAGALSHDYALEYVYATNDQQSKLERVYRKSVLNSDERTVKSFEYQDDETSFPSTSTTLSFSTDVSPGPSLETASMRWETTPMLADVNGDSRPDLIVLTQKCGVPDPDAERALSGIASSNEGPLLTGYECTDIDHKVFINKVVDATSSSDFEYDSGRSAALTDFLGALNRMVSGDSLQYAMIDINRDGYLDLLRGEQETGQAVSIPAACFMAAPMVGIQRTSSNQPGYKRQTY